MLIMCGMVDFSGMGLVIGVVGEVLLRVVVVMVLVSLWLNLLGMSLVVMLVCVIGVMLVLMRVISYFVVFRIWLLMGRVVFCMLCG